MDAGVVTLAPTCSATGVKTYTCQRDCGYTSTEDIAIDENAHAWDDGVVTTAPTCTTEGVKTYTCAHNNEHTRTEEIAIDDNNHDNDAWTNPVSATCLVAGTVGYYTCSRCDKKFDANKNEITNLVAPALDHDLKDVAALANTCYTDGYTAYKDCTRCDYTDGYEVIPAAHALVDVEARDKTCYIDGYTAHKACTVCRYTEGKIIDPAGHTGTWVDDGNYEYIVCTVESCGRKVVREKNNVIADPAFPGEATDTRIDFTDTLHAISGGDNGGKYLVFDFDVLLGQNGTATSTDYIFDVKVMDGAATAGKDGNLCVQFQFIMKNSVVSIIGDGTAVNSLPVTTPMGETPLTFRVVAVLDDTLENGIYESYYYIYAKVTGSDDPMTLVRKYTKTSEYAGCVSRYDGYKIVLTKTTHPEYILAFNNASFIRTNDTNYLYNECNHVISETVTPATCYAEGTVVRKCTNDGCGYTVTEYIPEAHTLGDVVAAKDATCTEKGHTAYQICSDCQNKIGYEVVPALGHDYAEWVYVDASNMQRVCNTCGRMQKSEKNVVIEDVDFPPANTTETRIDYTDALHAVSAGDDGGKYLVFDVDILIDKNALANDTANILTLKVMDKAGASGGNTPASFAFTMKNNVLSITGTVVNPLPVTTPMGETYISFRLVVELGATADASGNYLSKYYLYAKETGTDGPMTLVRTTTKSSTYAGTLMRSDNYKIVLYKDAKAARVLDVKNASFIRTNDTSYLYSNCDHVFTEWETVEDVEKCTTDGVITRSCTVDGCGYKETEYIPAHTLITVPSKAPTCTEDGYTASQTCSECDFAIASASVKKLGHVMSDWFDINDGAQQKKTCESGCGYYELRDVVENNPLTFDDGTVTNSGKITFSTDITVTEDKTAASDQWEYGKWSVGDKAGKVALCVSTNSANWASGRTRYAFFGTTDGSNAGNIYTLDFDLYIEPGSNATSNSSRVAAQLYFGGGSYSIGTYGSRVTRYAQSFSFGTTKTWISFRFVFTVTENGKAEVSAMVKNTSGVYVEMDKITISNSGIKLSGVGSIGIASYSAGGSFDCYYANISLTRHVSGYEVQ